MELSAREQKELQRRDQILNDNLWKVLLQIALPIVFYKLCNYLYGIYDMMVVQSTNIGDAADIVVLDQIRGLISTVGEAVAVSGGILVAKKYGENRLPEARRCANAFFTIALLIAGITLVFIPVGVPFLKLLKTDQTTIDNAMGYYYVQIAILCVTTINSCFISIEKAKGNAFLLLCLNFGVIGFKLFFTTLFAFGPFENVTITWLAVATLIAQSFMLICALVISFRPGNILRIRIQALNFNREDSPAIVKLAIPVFIDGFLFSYGKVYINTVATVAYGKMCVGALGISNTIAGLVNNILMSFKEAGSTIVSQNYGNKNGRRIQEYFRVNFVYIMALSIVGTFLLFIARKPIAAFFAPNDALYQEMIVNIFKWECLDLIFLGLYHAANAVFYGFAKTKLTMSLGMCNLFAYRIPILLFLMHVIKMDYEACGIAMFGSNTLSGIVAFIVVVIFMVRLPKREKYKELFAPKG